MLRSTLLTAFGLTVAAVLLLLPRVAEAGGKVGNGHAIDCQESVLANRLAGGGVVTFDCGLDPVAITLTSPKVITLPTTIDGGQAITLDGVNNTGLFQVNAGASLDLKNITLARGNAVHGNETTFLSNTAPNGGALFNYLTGHLALGNDTLMSNMGVTISNTGVLTVTGSTLAGNQGGGIGNLGLATVINSTFSGNSGGAGLKNIGSAKILNTTFAGNAGGGLINGSFNFIFIHNTLLAGNGANNCMGTITSLGHNLEDEDTCGLTASGDITHTNPLLGPLANNGGPTLTRALMPGSRAIDHGDNAGCPATDQRGVARVGNCDIGAFESLYRLFLAFVRK